MEDTTTSGGSNKSSAETPITFWQEVTDPKTKHSYYWNPATNEVNWTLPANAVISNPSDSTDKLAVLDSNGEPGASELGGYYDYYAKTWYGVDPDALREEQRAARPTTEDSKESSGPVDSQKKQGEPAAEDSSSGKGEGKKGGPDSGTAVTKPNQVSNRHRVKRKIILLQFKYFIFFCVGFSCHARNQLVRTPVVLVMVG